LRALVLTSAVALGAIWVLYPLVIMLLARLWGRRDPGAAASDAAPSDAAPLPPAVAVVVASRDDAATLTRRVRNLLASHYAPERLHVVVALDAAGSAARPEELAGIDPRVTVVRGDAPGGKAAALNAGVRAARGDVLVFTDAHQQFAPDAIGHLVAALRDGRTGAAAGALEIPVSGGAPTLAERYWRYEKWLRRNEALLHSTVGVSGAIYAMKASLWSPLPPGLILDDVYTPLRLVLRGHRVAFVAAAKATDTRRFKAEQEYRRKVRTLTGNIQLCAWLPLVLVPVRNPIWLQFVFHKLLRLLTPYLALALLVGLAALGARALGNDLPVVLGVAAVVALAVLLTRPALRHRARDLMAWGFALQAAVVVATFNGLRGRWDVWQR